VADASPHPIHPTHFSLDAGCAPERSDLVWALPYTVEARGHEGAASDVPRAYTLGPGADAFGEEDVARFFDALEATRASGDPGEVTSVVLNEGRLVWLVGVGEATPSQVRRAGAAVARAARGRERVATTIPSVGDEVEVEAFVAGATLGAFTVVFGQLDADRVPVGEIVLAGPAGEVAQSVLDRAVTLARASWRARFLATLPGQVKPPAFLASYAEELAAEAGLDVTVWDEAALAADGFGGILGVGRAAASPPRLIRLDYTPAGSTKKTPRVVLVGKGITFDSGGLSIKPADGMLTMKRDMTGGAVVMSVMAALGALGCPVRVTGMVPTAENAISGDALRPGDVITHFGGRTTEVTNTDAEGRLILADAMAYAVAELDPAVLVDVATLTGAIRVALGHRTAGFFSSTDALAAALQNASERSGEALCRMPLVDDYEDKLSSSVADADNAPGGPGAIMAALFLRKFAGSGPWAHIDMSSAAEAPEDYFDLTRGPTGFGARMLLTWLSSPEPLADL
jgi:leucyl aminopeptidase